MRHSSLFELAGVALGATTVVGLGWELWAELVAVRTGLSPFFVRLGTAGFIAAALGWAALARSWWSAALRPLAASVIAAVAVIGLWYLGRLWETFGDAMRGGFSTVGVYQAQFGLTLGPTGIAYSGVLIALAVAAYVAVAPGEGRRRFLTGLVLLAVLFDGATSLSEGAVIAFVISLLGAAWLVWALRRARAAAAARRQAPPGPTPATA